MIRNETVPYKNFGRCLKITNGTAEVLVTLDIGPRVIRYSLCGRENVLCEDVGRRLYNDDPAIAETFGKGSVWYNYGGHRIWLSPENMPLTYYPDQEPVRVKVLPNGAEFTPPVQRVTGVALKLRVEMDEEGAGVRLSHFATNAGGETFEKALWCLSVLSVGGLEVVPMPQNDTGLLPNRVLAVWPYDDCSDPRVFWGRRYLTLKQDENVPDPFKIGVNNNRGWAAYFNHDDLFVKRFRFAENGKYPDYGCSFETYVCGLFTEMESLDELVRLTPGSTMTHAERWELFPQVKAPGARDEAAVDALVKQYIEK